MKLLPCLALVAACSSTPAGPPAQSTLTGTVSADTTLTGVVALSGSVSIPSGVTVTVAAGTILEASTTTQIDVAGTLVLMGEKGNVVTLESANTGDYWGGVRVEGTYEMHYGKQVGGGIFTNGGTTTITDSEMTDSEGDFLVEDGGSVDVEFSNLGAEDGTNSHCNIHINSVSSFTFSHSNNAGSTFGLMLYGGSNTDFTHDNWLSNDTDIEPGASGTGDFDEGYFPAGQPAGVQGSSFANLSSSRLTDVGPR